ncbi:MAG: CarD family transcriptional regulator [Anaerolineae bacterium]
MFDVGDAVYHPTNGAGVIANLQRLPALKKDQRFYKIRMLGKTRTVLMVPVKKAEELGLRYAVSKDKVQEVLDLLSSEPEELPKQHKRRYKVCNDKLDTADIMQIAEVVRDLTWRRIENEKLNVPGRRIFKKAMELLTGELAVAQGLNLQAAEEQINEALKVHLQAAQQEA